MLYNSNYLVPMSIQELADRIGAPYKTVWKWVNRGELVTDPCNYTGYGPNHHRILICIYNWDKILWWFNFKRTDPDIQRKFEGIEYEWKHRQRSNFCAPFRELSF